MDKNLKEAIKLSCVIWLIGIVVSVFLIIILSPLNNKQETNKNIEINKIFEENKNNDENNDIDEIEEENTIHYYTIEELNNDDLFLNMGDENYLLKYEDITGSFYLMQYDSIYSDLNFYGHLINNNYSGIFEFTIILYDYEYNMIGSVSKHKKLTGKDYESLRYVITEDELEINKAVFYQLKVDNIELHELSEEE